MSERLKGTGVALITPFSESFQVDYESLNNLLQFTANRGVDYYVVQGTTGESATTTPEEKAAILNFVKNNNTAHKPVVYGLGGNNTFQVIEQLKFVDLSGVDAVLSVAPYYNKPSQKGLIAHFTAVADASPVPIILYNVPGRTATNMEAETTIALAEHENIIGIKEASGKLEQCMHIANHTADDFLLISGEDILTLPMLAVGGVGVISVLANAYANIFHNIVMHASSGNWEAARKASFDLLPINHLMYAESNPVGVKYALKVLEVCEDYVRLPLVPASAPLKRNIEQVIENYLRAYRN